MVAHRNIEIKLGQKYKQIWKGAEPPAGVTIYRVPEEKMKNSELKEYISTFPDDVP